MMPVVMSMCDQKARVKDCFGMVSALDHTVPSESQLRNVYMCIIKCIALIMWLLAVYGLLHMFTK